MVIGLSPLGDFFGADLVPQRDRRGTVGTLRGIGMHVVPSAVLRGDGEDVHGAVVEGLARGVWVHFLWVVGSCAYYVVRVMAGADYYVFHLV